MLVPIRESYWQSRAQRETAAAAEQPTYEASGAMVRRSGAPDVPVVVEWDANGQGERKK